MRDGRRERAPLTAWRVGPVGRREWKGRVVTASVQFGAVSWHSIRPRDSCSHDGVGDTIIPCVRMIKKLRSLKTKRRKIQYIATCKLYLVKTTGNNGDALSNNPPSSHRSHPPRSRKRIAIKYAIPLPSLLSPPFSLSVCLSVLSL